MIVTCKNLIDNLQTFHVLGRDRLEGLCLLCIVGQYQLRF